jgi:hypothetical protein
MSINTSYYVIAGYDLTDLETDKYRDWKWTDEGEQFLCNQVNGRVQLFDDPMSDRYLYLGKVLASGDEYYFGTTKFDVVDVQDAFDDVTCALVRLQGVGVITKDPKNVPVFQIIAFEECR